MPMFEALFGKKQKTYEEEAQLLLEELRWGIADGQFSVEQERTRRVEARFDKWWQMHGVAALEVASALEVPDELLDGPVTDGLDEGERREREVRRILREVWMRDGGRCLFSHRDRDLAFVALPNQAPDEEDAVGRPETEEMEAFEPPADGDDKRQRDKKAVAEAKKRREEKKRARARRKLRRQLARGFALVHRSYAEQGLPTGI